MAVFCFREVYYCWSFMGAHDFFMSKIVLCIPLVLKVTAFMGGCRYSIVPEG